MLYKQPTSKYYYVKLKHRGRVIRKSTGATTKRAAERFESELRGRLSKLRQQSGHTFADAALRWAADKKHKKSIHLDLMILEWFAPHLESTYLSEITRERVEQLRRLKREECGELTVNRYFALLRSLLRAARDDWEWVETIPKVPMFKVHQREPRFLSKDQWMSLSKELPSHLAGPAWFAVYTGLRTNAIQQLKWDWISRDGVTFPAHVMKNNDGLTIPLSAVAWQVIAECHQQSKSQENVFVSPAGNPWVENFKTRAWDKACKRANLEGVTFHDLRHTFASWMLQKGVPEHVVMELGGWKTRDAFKIYARFSSESLGRLAGYV